MVNQNLPLLHGNELLALYSFSSCNNNQCVSSHAFFMIQKLQPSFTVSESAQIGNLNVLAFQLNDDRVSKSFKFGK